MSRLQEGYITITPIYYDLTHYGALEKLRMSIGELKS